MLPGYVVPEARAQQRSESIQHLVADGVPVGVVHPLEIVEVQSGPYLNDDDVIRYEDSYGRS